MMKQLTFVLCIVILTAPNVTSIPDHASARPSVHILVAYYSQTGHTEKMARGVVEGVESVSGTVATLKNVTEVS
ncbi:MAG: hypothetical protein HQ515_12515, partial [Phycisphaeraceae bacterium]|nr:hypothetical protein [Phycisphaeraceae bacterium]